MAHSSLLTHRKLKRLTAHLSITRVQAIGHLELLWHCVAGNPQTDETGVLTGWQDIDVESACEWSGEPGMMAAALVSAGFVDRTIDGALAIHDWGQWMPAWIKSRISMRKMRAVINKPPNVSNSYITVRPDVYVNVEKNKGAGVAALFDETVAGTCLDTPAFRDSWQSWVVYRSERRAKLTPSTIKRQLATLARWGPTQAIAAIEQSISAGWVGLFEPGSNGRVPKPQPQYRRR